jgi:hypothetical protein
MRSSSNKSVLFMLVLLALAGCAREADENIAGPDSDQDVADNADQLDPDSSSNQSGYFYDEFAVGVRYSCLNESGVAISGYTRENGMFVCPLASRVVFGLGRNLEIELGSIDLEHYVASSRPIITPVVLAGITADEYSAQAINVAMLLRAIDSDMDPTDRFMHVSRETHQLISDWGVSLDVTDGVVAFGDKLERFLKKLNREVVLTQGGLQESPAAVTARLRDVIARTSAGIYMTYMPMYGDNGLPTDDPDYQQSGGEMLLMRSRSGQIRGFAQLQYLKAGTGNSALAWKRLLVDPGSRIDGSGQLVDFLTDPASDVDLEFTGRFINGVTYGDKELLKDGDRRSALLPEDYQYRRSDVGEWADLSGNMRGQLNLTQIASVSPVLETENYAPGDFPVHLTLTTVTYPKGRGTEGEDRRVTTYPTPADFGDPPPASVPTETVRLTLLESGDIVTDVDGDCSAVDGDLVDVGGQQEFLIGLIGSVRLDETDNLPRATMLLRDHNPASPSFGFQLGFDSMVVGGALSQVRVNITTGGLELVGECSGGGHVCVEQIEWADDYEYVTLLQAAWAALGEDETFDIAVMDQPGYFGRLVSAGPTTCP